MTRSRAATLALLARLPEDAIRRPRTQDAWSIADVLAHIAAWEEEGARRLDLIARGHGDRIHFYDTMPEADRFNARAVAAARRLRLPALLARLGRTRARLVAALRRLPPRALVDPTHDLPAVVWLREFAWTHEAAHRREIQAWWRAHRTERP
ncbi:MAG: DinB family protein [Candidatus Rokuibacteriota bacterium]